MQHEIDHPRRDHAEPVGGALMIRLAFAFLLSLCVSAQAQLNGGGTGFPGPGGPVVAAYQGPGDVVGSAIIWGSCARVYNASLASTSTSLCDLVAVTGGAAVCTLRGSATGFVDLAASYCAGTTPSAACAAASGGSCKVTKVYDQAGGTAGWTQGTLASMPALTFSALNGLPSMTCAASCVLSLTSGSITQTQPFTVSYVSNRTGATGTSQHIVSNGGGVIRIGYNNAAATALLSAGLALTAAATDSAFHAFQMIGNSTSSVIVADGAATTGNASTSAFSASAFNLMTANGAGSGLTGQLMEVGLWSGAWNATQYGNMNTNQHGTSGYNF